MAPDWYAEARDMARSLDQENLKNEAQSLRDAIDNGSTATEILMALRRQLKRIDQANLSISLEMRGRIRHLVAELALVLGP
jgi:hypothetical protein